MYILFSFIPLINNNRHALKERSSSVTSSLPHAIPSDLCDKKSTFVLTLESLKRSRVNDKTERLFNHLVAVSL